MVEAGAQIGMPAWGWGESNWLDRGEFLDRVPAEPDIRCGLVEPQGGGPIWEGIVHRMPAARSTACATKPRQMRAGARLMAFALEASRRISTQALAPARSHTTQRHVR